MAFLATYLDVNGATILTDTIAFQSEITETNHTPLPSSAVLLATGLLATQASTSRRRLRAQREEPRSGA